MSEKSADSERAFEIAAETEDWRRRLCGTLRRPFWLLSWTWALANVLKPEHDREGRARIIRLMNMIYFLGSVGLVTTVIACTGDDLDRIRPDGLRWWAVGLQYVLLWRFFEVLRAFHQDAFDKLLTPGSTSSLTFPERVRLALRSYLELIVDFALIYALLPVSAWVPTENPEPPASVTDLLWYSANVITTSGGGGFVPMSIPLKVLSVGEVFAGVILLIVCFTVYVSRALGPMPGSASGEGK